MNNILISGLYFSGSGALTDLLAEYKSVACIKGEFDDVRRVGMLGDLVDGTIDQNKPLAIDAAINGFWYPTRINPSLSYHFKSIAKLILKKTFFGNLCKRKSYKDEKKRAFLLSKYAELLGADCGKLDKVKLLKDYIHEVSLLYSNKFTKHCLFDQPIFFNCHSEIWPLVFDPYKLLIVYRDPRDQVAQLIKNNLIFFDIETPTRGLIELYGDTRFDAVRYEVDAMNARYRNAKNIQKLLGEDKVKLIKFEDLIINYENEKKMIEDFLVLRPSDHVKKFNFLNPGVSEKNIGLYKFCLTEDEINYIEKSDLYKDLYLISGLAI